MGNIAVIPARSGSKGLKDKNIRQLQGKPLLAYSIMAARDSGLFSDVMVSTDSGYYATVARQYGADVPFLRSRKTAGDTAGSWEMVMEVLRGYRKMEHSPLLSMTLKDDLSLAEFRAHSAAVPRQRLERYYRINGALYIRRVDYTGNDIKILDGKEYAYIMDRRRSVDIDTVDDFEYAAFLTGGRYQGKITVCDTASRYRRCV